MKKYRRFASVLLCLVFIMSMTSCGKKDVVVEEYGGNSNTDLSHNTATATSSDSKDYEEGDGMGLKGAYGDVVRWEETFTAKGITIRVNQSKNMSDNPINVYNTRMIKDPIDKEAAIVKSLFGDSAKKIEELRYTDEKKYMSMLYKYRALIGEFEYMEESTEPIQVTDRVYEYDPEPFKIIDSSFDKTYKWVDDSKYYIHMYEGKYKGINYGLIIAYDKVSKREDINFYPISIDDYFPDKNYKTLLVESNNSLFNSATDDGEDQNENKCSFSEEEASSMATDFLKELMLDEKMCKVTHNEMAYGSSILDNNNMPIGYFGPYMYGDTDTKDNGMEILAFSDSDFVSSYRKAIDNDKEYRDVDSIKILGEQKDRVTEAYEKHGWDIYDYLGMYNSEGAEEANIDINGYALFLDFGAESMLYNYPNTGQIMITDKGIFGADLTFTCEMEEVVENVKLLDFEKIKESLKNDMEESLDLEAMNDPDSLEVYIMNYTYYPYTDKDAPDKVIYIPAWEFQMAQGGTAFAYYVINAIDGTVIERQFGT